MEKEIANELIEDEIIDNELIEDQSDDFEITEKKEDSTEQEIRILEEQIKGIQAQVRENRFPRSETKTDFASGIINTEETKKIANLEDEEIYDLIEKRKFYNFLRYFGWDGLATRVIKNVRDVEDYSLSRSGKLLDSVFIDRSRNEAKNIQEERRSKK